MRRTLVAGNWKMNGSRASIDQLLAGLKSADLGVVETLVCPPSIYLQQVAEQLCETAIGWGGQNLCAEPKGAFTGEISAAMLADFGCTYALVGHSERRALYGETDACVAAKFRAAQQSGLVPVLCVGETLAEREAEQTLTVIERQLAAVLDLAPEGDFVVAYEPVWAIGTGLSATPEQAQVVHAALRAQLAVSSAELAEKTRILYGGSVNAANAAELFAQPDIDGGLVGGASLQADQFVAICRAAG